MQQYPFLFSKPGYVGRLDGKNGDKDFAGLYWSNHKDENNRPNYLTFYNLFLNTQDINGNEKTGRPVRYVVNRTDTTQRNKFISSPYNFPYSGYYSYGGGVYDQGSNGRWWSRSSYTTAGQAYYFYLDANGYVDPQDYASVGAGFAVRCVGE